LYILDGIGSIRLPNSSLIWNKSGIAVMSVNILKPPRLALVGIPSDANPSFLDPFW
jgi:hypothetical protein